MELAVAGVLSPTTREMYLHDLRLFCRNIVQVLGVEPLAATYADLLQWWRWTRETPAGRTGVPPRPATINRRVAAVRRFYREAALHGLLPGGDPAAGLPLLRVSHEPKGRALTWEEVRRLLDEAPLDGTLADLRDRVILWVLLLTGCRVSELTRIAVSDLVLDGGVPVVTFRRKGGGEDRQPLVPDLALLIDAWRYRGRIDSGHLVRACVPAAGGWVVREGALARRTAYDVVERLAQRAGLGAGVGPHDLRKTFATLAHLAGADLLDTADALGHAKLDTTRGYVHQVGRYARHPGALILERVRAAAPRPERSE